MKNSHLRTAALVGMVVGALVGISEAVAAAAEHQRLLPLADFWRLWAVTVGTYATAGWAAFGILGIILGGIAAAVRGGMREKGALVYYILGGAAVPAALMLGRADLDIPPESLIFLLLRVAGASVVVGAGAGAAAFLIRRRQVQLAGAGALPLGYVAAGGFWARWAPEGPSVAERAGAVAIGLLVCAVVYLVSLVRSRGVGHRRGRLWPAVLALWPIPFAAVVAWAGVRVAYPKPRAGAPNIILVSVDALRADRLGCYGNTRGLTPRLDGFARDAVVFDKCFASSPWTLGSLGALFVSEVPSEVGLWRKPGDANSGRFEGGIFTAQPTLAEVLRRAGYMTAVELVNPMLRRDRGCARGIIRFRNPDDFRGDVAPALPRLGRYEDWFLCTSLGWRTARALYRSPKYYSAPHLDRHAAERVVRDCSAWLETRPSRPLFLWTHLMDTHVPYNLAAESAATKAAFPRPPFEPTDEFYKNLVLARVQVGDAGKRYVKAMYDDEVRYADEWLGWFMDHLRTLGLYDGSLIIVTADHGEELWDHGGFEHGRTMYDEVLHVPLLIKYPRARHAGVRVTAQVALIDLLPTVLDVAGAAPPRGVRGRTLVEPLGDRVAPGSGELHAEMTLYGEELKALRTPAYKLVFHTESRALEVYDLRADPRERRNLAGDPQVAADLRQRLMKFARESERRLEWWERYGEHAPALDERSLEQMRSIGYMAP